MAMPSRTIEDPHVELRSMLRLVDEPSRVPNVSIRTCTACGDHTAFVRDAADDGWFRCTTCGHFA
jgi:hypothetical protein